MRGILKKKHHVDDIWDVDIFRLEWTSVSSKLVSHLLTF